MLSVLCLSPVPVLRCVALRRIEFSTLLIPPGVELLFNIALLFINRHGTRGRYHHLLCAEGVSYFLLALMDFLTHAIPVLHQDLLVFKIVDIILGGLTVVPLFFFTVWFHFTAQQELIHMIPVRLQTPTKHMLASCIPLIIASNAIGAFIGVSYRTIGDVNVVGFIDERGRFLWKFFNMFSLTLLAFFEVVAFFLLFGRLMRAVLDKGRRELVGGTGEIHHFRGIIPINLGMLLSLVETLIGFTNQSFALEITRRGTKAVGRVLIILGLLRGWDYLEDVRFVLQQAPKTKRTSRFSIRQLLPNIRSPVGETRTPEYGHERVSVRYPRGRAPTLHLRLSEFDVSPVMRALRSPTRSSNSLRIHLIPETVPAGSTAGAVSGGQLDNRYPFYKDASSDVPATPTTPNSPWVLTEQTTRLSSSNNHTGDLQSPVQVQDGGLYHPTHMRGDTMSSTMSNLQAEVMTLSGSPPDPGFVLPIPSRSRSRQKSDLSPANLAQTTEPGYAGDTPVGHGFYQFAQEIPPRRTLSVNGSDVTLSKLEPPQLREPSWTSESSDTSSAVISTAARLTRANTGASITSVAIRRAPAVTLDDDDLARQQNEAADKHPLSSPLPTARLERPGGDAD